MASDVMNTPTLTVGFVLGMALSMAASAELVPWWIANFIFTCLAAALGGYLGFKVIEKWRSPWE